MKFTDSIQSALEETPGVISMTRMVVATNTFFFAVMPMVWWVSESLCFGKCAVFDQSVTSFCISILTITYSLKVIQSFADNLAPTVSAPTP